jgi:hypothetical protein
MSSPTRTANELAEMKRRAREAAATAGHDLGRFHGLGTRHQAFCRHCNLLVLVHQNSDGTWGLVGPALIEPCAG